MAYADKREGLTATVTQSDGACTIQIKGGPVKATGTETPDGDAVEVEAQGGCGCLVVLALLIISTILFAGDPDLVDALIHWLMK